MIDESQCYIPSCDNKPIYLIEWYGFNQHGENPLVVDERAVCTEFEHIVLSSFHDRFGGNPDGIVLISDYEQEHPDLVQQVYEKMDTMPTDSYRSVRK